MSESVAYWPQRERNPAYEPVDPDYGTGNLLGAVAGSVWNDSPLMATRRVMSTTWGEIMDVYHGRPALSPEDANKKYGIEGKLRFTEPTYESEGAKARVRALAEMERDTIIANSSTWGRAPAKLATTMAVFAMDPVNLLSMFVPFDEVRFIAPLMSGIRSPMGRSVAKEVVNNVVGQFAVEPFTIGAAWADKADYDFLHNSAVNIGMGGLFGLGFGVMRGKGKGIRETMIGDIDRTMQRDAHIVGTLSQQESADMMKSALIGVIRDEPAMTKPSDVLRASYPDVMAQLDVARADMNKALLNPTAPAADRVNAVGLYIDAINQTKRFYDGTDFEADLKSLETRLNDLLTGKTQMTPEMANSISREQARVVLEKRRADLLREQADVANRQRLLEEQRRTAIKAEVEKRAAAKDARVPDGSVESRVAAVQTVARDADDAINRVNPHAPEKSGPDIEAATQAELKAEIQEKSYKVKAGEKPEGFATPSPRPELPSKEQTLIDNVTVRDTYIDGSAPVEWGGRKEAQTVGLKKFFHDIPGSMDPLKGSPGGTMQGYPFYRRKGVAAKMHNADEVGVGITLRKALDLTQGQDSPFGTLAQVLGYDIKVPEEFQMLRDAIKKDPDYIGNELRRRKYDGIILEKDSDLAKSEGKGLEGMKVGDRGKASMVLLLGNRKVRVDRDHVKTVTKVTRERYESLGSADKVIEVLNTEMKQKLSEGAEVYFHGPDGKLMFRVENIDSGLYEGWLPENMELRVSIDQDRIKILEAKRGKLVDDYELAAKKHLGPINDTVTRLEDEMSTLEKELENASDTDKAAIETDLSELRDHYDLAIAKLDQVRAEVAAKYDPGQVHQLDNEIRELSRRPKRLPESDMPVTMDKMAIAGFLTDGHYFAVHENKTKLELEEDFITRQANKKAGKTVADEVAIVRPEEETALNKRRAAVTKMAKMHGLALSYKGKPRSIQSLEKGIARAIRKLEDASAGQGQGMHNPMGGALADELARNNLTKAMADLNTKGKSPEEIDAMMTALLDEYGVTGEHQVDSELMRIQKMRETLSPEGKRKYEADLENIDEFIDQNAEPDIVETMDLSPEEKQLVRDQLGNADGDLTVFETAVDALRQCIGQRLG